MPYPRPILLALLLPILAGASTGSAHGEPPVRQVADLGTRPVEGPSAPTELAVLGDHLYFAALDDLHGRELWRTDGTEAGTQLVADLCPGRCSGGADHLTPVGDRLFFVSGGATGQLGVWVTDGTAGGTVLSGLLPLPPHHDVHEPTVFRGAFYFTAAHPELGSELWVSDGTPGGTSIAVDVCPGDCSSSPQELTALGDLLLFKATDEDGDRELWRSDGSPEGTFRVADICPGPCPSDPFHLAAVAGRVYFNADDGVRGRELWVSDGTAAGTLFLEDFRGEKGSTPRAFAGPDGQIYIETAGGSADVRLWRTDGTPGGAEEAVELLPGGHENHPRWILPGPERLYFSVADSQGEDLWVLDQGAASSRRIAGPFHRTSPGCCGFGRSGSRDGALAFTVQREDGHLELWTTDGTAAGTRRSLETGPDDRGGLVLGPLLDDLWTFARDDGIHDQELWVSDGTAAGTRLLRNVHPPEASSNPRDLTSWRGSVYFNAGAVPFDDPPERSSWRTAGPDAGAEVVDPDSWLGSPTPVGDRLYFTDPETGFPMALTDPHLGAVLLARAASAREFTPAGDRVFFSLRPDGQQVWTTDGTPEGTRLLRDVNPEWSSRCDLSPCPPIPTYPHELTAAGSRLFFIAASGSEPGPGPELWTSDGTTAGTVRVPGAPAPGELAALGDGTVLLTVSEGPEAGVWRSDGTRAGTRRIASLEPGANPRRAVEAEGLVYFLATAEDGRPFLWRSDATPGGTTPLVDLGAPYAADPNEMTTLGSRLLFTRFDPDRGEELWVSDGTPAGTGLVADLRPGPGSSNPTALTTIGEVLLFAADDGESGHEPWVTDGTAAGTFRLADVQPGPESSSPGGFARAGDWIILDARAGETGREPWAILLEPGGDGDDGDGGDGEPPPVPDAPPILSDAFPGFRFWVRITAGGDGQPVRREAACIPETLCVSGAVPGRSELFVRIVGPKPNGRLWPTLVRFSTSTIEVWIEQTATGSLRYYRLDGATPGSSDLTGLFDRQGFVPQG